MSLLATVVFSGLEFEDDNLLRTVLGNDRCLNFGAFYDGLSDDGFVTAQHENAIEHHRVPLLSVDLFHTKAATLGDSVLLSTRCDYGIHDFSPGKNWEREYKEVLDGCKLKVAIRRIPLGIQQ